MKKIYVLDTCVYLNDAEALFKFGENSIVIPFPVLEEIDKKKNEQNTVGRNARAFSRYIDDLRKKGSLIDGVEVNDCGGKICVVLFDQTVANCLPYQNMNEMDNRILATAKFVSTYSPILKQEQKEVILVTQDTNLRIRADVSGIIAEDYQHGKVSADNLYTGEREIYVNQNIIDELYSAKKIPFSMLRDIEEIETPYSNECLVIKSCGSKQSALGRYNEQYDSISLMPQNMKTCDILPRNTEQQFALDLLRDPTINLVTMTGKAGSGKTIMALAAGLHHVLKTNLYSKILLLKPIVSMDNGHELGFLPGSMEEKLSPWMASYADNIEQIMAGYNSEEAPASGRGKKDLEAMKNYIEKQRGKVDPIRELIDHGKLEFGSAEHIRGRSLPNQYIIVDEAQNFTVHALKTLITRAGEGTKIVLMGDISQIDTPYLDMRSNGLTVIIEKFKSHNVAGHINFKKSERSALAELAANIL